MIHYFVYIEGKIAPAMSILWTGYGPEFRRGYGWSVCGPGGSGRCSIVAATRVRVGLRVCDGYGSVRVIKMRVHDISSQRTWSVRENTRGESLLALMRSWHKPSRTCRKQSRVKKSQFVKPKVASTKSVKVRSRPNHAVYEWEAAKHRGSFGLQRWMTKLLVV